MARTKQEILAQYQQQESQPATAEPQKFRTLAQGASFGFSDEIEAAVRSIIPGSPEYSQIRDELRSKLSAYKQANPGEALTYELAGSLVPSIAMMAIPGAQPAAGANLLRIAGTSAVESGLSSIGQSEAETGGEFVSDVTSGTAAGTVFGTATEVALGKLGKLGRKLIDYTRAKFGGADTAVQKELMRLTESTGKSVDEVIADVASGRIIADNMTLGQAIKSMVNEGGLTRSEILEASGKRAARTQEEAMSGLRETLTPNQGDPNVIRARSQTQEQLKAEESSAYKDIFANKSPVSQEVSDQMLNILQSIPASRSDLSELYQAENLVPLFREMPDGSVQFTRAPTLEDAEILRRSVRDISGAKFQAGQGTIGASIGKRESQLKSGIDVESPELATVRANYAARAGAQELFELGQKRGLTMNVDELEVLVQSLPAEKLDALRAGMMDAINNRARRSGTTIRDLANEDRQLGAALRVILPKEQSQSVLQSVGRAAEAGEMNRLIQPQAGSPTQALQREQALRGGGVSAEDFLRGTQGDPMSLIRVIKNIVPSGQGLTDNQMMQVAQVLYSESPEFVESALKDKTKLSALLVRAEEIAKTMASAARISSEQQAVQYAQE